MTNDAEGVRHRVAVVMDDEGLMHLVREIIATHLPSATVEVVPFGGAAASEADTMIVDASVRGLAGVAAVQELRARGYSGAVVMLAARCDEALERPLLALAPARCVARADMARALPAALDELSAPPALSDDLAPVQRELRRTQQLIAMGTMTSRIQHTLNNPLAALLAEAQLLEMEELAEDHRAAVKRIIELCRRLVGMVRNLDSGTGRT